MPGRPAPAHQRPTRPAGDRDRHEKAHQPHDRPRIPHASLLASHLTPRQIGDLLGPNRAISPDERNILQKVITGQPIGRRDLSRLEDLLDRLPPGRTKTAVASAIRDARDTRRQVQMQKALLDALRNQGLPAAAGQPGEAPRGEAAPVAMPSVEVPEAADEPRGPAVSLGATFGLVPAGQAGKSVEASEKLQATRTIRLVNTARHAVTFHVRYEATTDRGKRDWFPDKGAIKVELKAGESVDVKDGDWLVHATRARIWGEGGGQRWLRFRDRDLPIVPEVDDRGRGGYYAEQPQVFHFTIR